jgi:cellobiose transport system substrate-binding protein
MLKKTVVGLVLLSLAVFLVIGCSKDTDKASGDKIKLTLWYWNGSIDDNIIAKVSEQFPEIQLQAIKIGDDYKTKLTTTLAAGSGGPDIAAINNWVSELFPVSDKFVNLRDYGADDIATDYLDWKWKQGITPDGQSVIALPMDIGPSVLFYRADLFEKAGLPIEPKQVSELLSTWDSYIEAGKKLAAAFPDKKIHMTDSIVNLYYQVLWQSETRYFDTSDNFIGDQEQVKKAWDYAVQAHKYNLSAKTDQYTAEWNALMTNNGAASFVGAVWMKKILKDGAPNTAGKWRITNAPGGAGGDNGGSFIGVLKQSKHPKEAYEVIKWLMNSENQLKSYTDTDLYPSTPSVYKDPALLAADPFFGAEPNGKYFFNAAQQTKAAYQSPKDSIVDSAIVAELVNVEKQNKDPDKAWSDAMSKIKKDLSR